MKPKPRNLHETDEYRAAKFDLPSSFKVDLGIVENGIADDPEDSYGRDFYDEGFVVDMRSSDLAVTYVIVDEDNVALIGVSHPRFPPPWARP